MIEVTEEMRQAGADVIDAADERDDRWAREHISVAIYRAMRALEPKAERPVKAAAYRYPPDGIAPELDTYLVQQADRLDVLQTLVLELARRTPGNAEVIVRLAAELEAVR